MKTIKVLFGLLATAFTAYLWAFGAATANLNTASKEADLMSYPVAGSTHIYQGTMVCLNSSGYLVPAADTSGYTNCVGVAYEEVNNTGSNGDLRCRVQAGRRFLLAATSITQAMVGTQMYVVDDQTVDDVAGVSNGIRAGILTEYISSTQGWVRILGPSTEIGAVGTSDISTAAVTAAKLSSTLKNGYIPLDLFTAQIISSNAIPDSGNFLDGNTDPEIIRANGATDKAAKISWPAASVIEIQFAPFVYPPDLDDAVAVEVHLLARMASGGMDTPVIAVGYFEGIGDTNAGGNTSALSVTLTEKTVTIAAGDVGAAPKVATVTLTPAAHANEAVELYGAWIEYTRA